MATNAKPYDQLAAYTPYTPAEDIEYPKPNIPDCWTPGPVKNVTST